MKLHRDLWPAWEGESEVLKVFGPEDFAPPEPARHASPSCAAASVSRDSGSRGSVDSVA